MQALNGDLIEFGEFRLDTEKKILWRGEQVVSLPLKSIELLCVLIENRGEVVGKDALMRQVWKDSFVEESVLTQNIYLLRKTLQKKGDGKNLIKNVPRRGYLFGGEVRTACGSGLTNAPETNGADFVIERHLFEKIEIEEETSGVKTLGDAEETRRQGDTEKKRVSLPNVSASPRLRAAASVISLSLLIAVGAFFYFRNNQPSPQRASAFPNVGIKPFNSNSKLKTLAILPMKSSDEKEKNFAADLTKDLSNRLGSLNKFNVKRIEAGEARADYVLDSDAQVEKNNFLVNARLIDAANGANVWSEKFASGNLIQLQDAISNGVSKIILERLTPEERERVSKKMPTNIAAYETFQNGYRLWRNRNDGTAYFKKAIELDANFARAYVGLASQKMMDGGKDSAVAREAVENLNKAFEIDENLADAYAVRGFMQIFHERDWAEAEKSLRHALGLDSNNVNAHHWLAVLFSIHRRLDEAKTEMQIALELDPMNPTLTADLGQLYYFAGDAETAKRYCEQALALEPNHEFANVYLSRINHLPEIGDKDAVLKLLNQAAAGQGFMTLYINVDPQYDSLRDDARFQSILRKMNL